MPASLGSLVGQDSCQAPTSRFQNIFCPRLTVPEHLMHCPSNFAFISTAPISCSESNPYLRLYSCPFGVRQSSFTSNQPIITSKPTGGRIVGASTAEPNTNVSFHLAMITVNSTWNRFQKGIQKWSNLDCAANAVRKIVSTGTRNISLLG